MRLPPIRALGRAPGGQWRWLVPVVCALAGLMFATSHQASRGTNLRSSETADLAGVVRTAESKVADETATLAALQAQVDAATAQAGQVDAAVAAAQAQGQPLQQPAGLTAVAGPALAVILDDAHGDPPAGVDQNQLVVHQSDMQAVVNALWAGGAEAMSVAGQRIVATSAVRCVGNTLLLNGRVYSPPFRVVAIGPAGTMQEALDRSPGVALFKQAAGYYGLGYTVENLDRTQLPAYTGPTGLSYAKAGRR